LLEFAFERMEIERVEFRADIDNKRSIFAMKSIGCVEEGVLRSNGMRSDGTRRDSIILSILKSEWESKTKKDLESKIEKMPATNIGLAIWRLKCFFGTFVQGSTAVILLNIRR